MIARLSLCLLALAAPLAAAPPKPSLERRVQRMEDESAIRRILIQYGAFLDAKDFASYAGLFARNGEWIGGFGHFTGPAAIERMLIDHLGTPEPGYINKTSYHLMSNPIIQIEGDHAHVTSKYLFVTRSPDNKPVPALAGRYVDDFVREEGQWKVLRRVTHGAIPYRNGDDPAPPPPPATAPPATAPVHSDEAADRAAIHALLVAYGATLDRRDFDAFGRLFAKQGEYVAGGGMSANSGAAAAEMMRRVFAANAQGYKEPNFHLFFNEVIELTGRDTAHATSMSLYMAPDQAGQPHAVMAARYDDDLVREEGRWAFARRTVHALSANTVKPPQTP